MTKIRPFRRLEIDAQICAKISQIIEENRYRGSFTSFVESILDLFADGLLKDVREKPIVTATRVRPLAEGESHRKGKAA